MIKIITWSTFEDAIPKKIKNKWVSANHLEIWKCKEHDTVFNRTEEPCWQCYQDYE